MNRCTHADRTTQQSFDVLANVGPEGLEVRQCPTVSGGTGIGMSVVIFHP
jgi:hypothetical protein